METLLDNMVESFAPGSCDPLTAYALGMVAKMLRPSKGAPLKMMQGHDEAQTQARVEKLRHVLGRPELSTEGKKWLVKKIEDAEQICEVWVFLRRASWQMDADDEAAARAAARAAAPPAEPPIAASTGDNSSEIAPPTLQHSEPNPADSSEPNPADS